jgi:hypothetical protein
MGITDTVTVTNPELLVGSAARFAALNGSGDIFEAACATRLAMLQLDRAINGDREDPEGLELALFAVRNAAEITRRLNANHGTGE